MIWCLISSITLFLVSYHHQEELVCLWIYCDNITKMQYLNIADGFQTWLSMHFYWSLLWSLPVFLYQLSQFLKPGLHRAEWVNIILFGCWGTLIVLITSGFLFTNYLWQHIVEVFFSFGSQHAEFVPNIQYYLSFYRKTTVAFAMSATLPWFSFLFVKWGIFSYQQTVKLRRWWILGIFMMATIMSPPDVLSQIVIALPLWFFLELAWLILAVIEAQKKHKRKESEYV